MKMKSLNELSPLSSARSYYDFAFEHGLSLGNESPEWEAKYKVPIAAKQDYQPLCSPVSSISMSHYDCVDEEMENMHSNETQLSHSVNCWLSSLPEDSPPSPPPSPSIYLDSSDGQSSIHIVYDSKAEISPSSPPASNGYRLIPMQIPPLEYIVSEPTGMDPRIWMLNKSDCSCSTFTKGEIDLVLSSLDPETISKCSKLLLSEPSVLTHFSCEEIEFVLNNLEKECETLQTGSSRVENSSPQENSTSNVFYSPTSPAGLSDYSPATTVAICNESAPINYYSPASPPFKRAKIAEMPIYKKHVNATFTGLNDPEIFNIMKNLFLQTPITNLSDYLLTKERVMNFMQVAVHCIRKGIELINLMPVQ